MMNYSHFYFSKSVRCTLVVLIFLTFTKVVVLNYQTNDKADDSYSVKYQLRISAATTN